MSSRVFISGFGIISALGIGAKENLLNLKSKTHGIKELKILQTRKNVVVGEVDKSNNQLSDLCHIASTQPKSRTALLGLIAAKEAVEMAGLGLNELHFAGFINGTSTGGMDLSEDGFIKILNEKNIDYYNSFGGHDCGASTQLIANKLKINGYLSTISTACSSSANTIIHAAQLISTGYLDCVIAGGTDALTNFTLNGFDSLKILDREHCKPFDQNRMGLNLGEGAAFLVLESEKHLAKRNATKFAELVGFGNANDAYHQTASSPEGKGAFNAIKKALHKARLKPDQINYINAHGTGTENNDSSESLALKSIFDAALPHYSSTKAYTGHTLAAAGSIEAVFSIMAIQEQMIWANINLENPMDLIAPPISNCINHKVDMVLSNSFGFGGNCSSLIFSKA